jgi:hypothetical protein
MLVGKVVGHLLFVEIRMAHVLDIVLAEMVVSVSMR